MKKLILFSASLVLALTARADIIVFNTLGPGNHYVNPVGWSVGSFLGGPVYEVAAPFVAAVSGNLTTIELGLTWVTLPATTVNVFLYGDAGGAPDNSNQIFLGSGAPTTQFGFSGPNFPLVTIAVTGSVSVAAGSNYWLVLKPVAPIGFDVWNKSDTTFGQPYFSIDDSTWAPPGEDPPNPLDTLPAFRISAVPEPAVWALMSLGLLCSAQYLRGRNRR
jgi:hypothetical protein